MQNNTAIVNAEPKEAPLQLPEETASLIKASIAENTQKAYQRALQSLETWLSGRTLSDALLANYITRTCTRQANPHATIGQNVAAVKWQLKHQSQETFKFPYHSGNIGWLSAERAKTEGVDRSTDSFGRTWRGSVSTQKPKARLTGLTRRYT